MMVLDASAAIELLLGSTKGVEVASHVSLASSVLAPQLIDVEVLQVLRRLEASKVLSKRRAQEALDDFRALDVVRYDHEPLLDRIWALRGNVSAYDATYVALAESADATLVTCDARLGTLRGAKAKIVVVADAG